MAKYRKKPLVVEAIQFKATKKSFNEIRKWIGKKFYYNYQDYPRVFISTLEGAMGVKKNDWIIKGVKGEFYPIKNDIFLETYEKVKD